MMRTKRRAPITLLLKDKVNARTNKQKVARQPKQAQAVKPLSTWAQVVLIFTWLYFAIVLLGLPALTDGLREIVSPETVCFSFLVVPALCLLITWIFLRQKHWLSFLAFGIVTLGFGYWMIEQEFLFPTLQNPVTLGGLLGLLLVPLLLARRAQVRISHRLVDQAEFVRLRFRPFIAIQCCLGISAGALIIWLVAYQLKKFDWPMLDLAFEQTRLQLDVGILYTYGAAITVFCLTYFMLAGGPGLRLLFALALGTLLYFQVMQPSQLGDYEVVIQKLVHPFHPSALDEEYGQGLTTEAEKEILGPFDYLRVTGKPAAYVEYPIDDPTSNSDLRSSTTRDSQHRATFLQTVALRLSEDWFRLALVLITILMPLRILGYSLSRPI